MSDNFREAERAGLGGKLCRRCFGAASICRWVRQIEAFFSFLFDTCATVQLFVQTEAAFETMMELGALGCLQFNDLNKNISAFQR